MNKWLVILGIVAVLAVITARAHAEEPAPDFGDTNLLLIACQTMTELGENQDIEVKNCRRAAPDEVNGYRATIRVRLMTDVGAVFLTVRLHKSLWSVSTAVQDN